MAKEGRRFQWFDGFFLALALLAGLWLSWQWLPNRDLEEFWQDKIAELLGLEVTIEQAELVDGIYTLSNVQLVADAASESADDRAFLELPEVKVSPGNSRHHWLVDLEQPVINYYHSGEQSNFSRLFQQLKTSGGNRETFTQSDAMVLQLRVNQPKMLMFYSRETGKKHILQRIYQVSNQHPLDIEYATLNNPISSFKLKKMRGNERQVAIKTALHLLSAVEKKGKQRLDAFENSHRKAQAALERRRNKVESTPQRSTKPKKKKQKPYEPLSVY